MPIAIKAAAGIIGSILAIIALVIAVLKGLLALISFITLAIKIVVIGLFVAVFIIIGLMVFRTFRDKRKSKE
jgi:membrane protein YdbS with pleckstrin-like domain